MDISHAFFLGLIQGFTEFLPVSSSGHLVLLQHFLGIKIPGVTFEVIVHTGTLFSIILVFWEDIYNLISGMRSSVQKQKLLWLLLIGSMPTAIMGFFFAPFFKSIFEQPQLVGLMLLFTGVIVFLIAKLEKSQPNLLPKEISWKDALVTGFFQGLAIIPGISRSGSTIFGALLRGLDRETAVRFSFLLALPAIAGATCMELLDLFKFDGWSGNWVVYLVGAIVSFISGVVAIRVFIKLLSRGKFYYFAYYCWLVGTLTILFIFFKS